MTKINKNKVNLRDNTLLDQSSNSTIETSYNCTTETIIPFANSINYIPFAGINAPFEYTTDFQDNFRKSDIA